MILQNDLEYSSNHKALIVFVDIIDSSLYSSILGVKRFAEIVLKFQSLFEELGRAYFDDDELTKDKRISFLKSCAEGDEGCIFLVDFKQDPSDLVYKAIKFVFELKAYMKIVNLSNSKEENDYHLKEIRIAAGIHYGDVALVTPKNHPKFISKILGYTINYAKRIEASSRVGTYSQVFLSKEAYELVDGCPIVFEKHNVSLKGIESNDEAYEVRSIFLEDVPKQKDENFDNFYLRNYNEFNFHREAWLRSYLLSFLYSKCANAKPPHLNLYNQKMDELLWKNPNESDPILRFARAADCEGRGKITQQISYLKKLLDDFPTFIQARIKLAHACSRVIADKNTIEEIFVKDTVEEFLDKFERILSDREKTTFNEILTKITSKKPD